LLEQDDPAGGGRAVNCPVAITLSQGPDNTVDWQAAAFLKLTNDSFNYGIEFGVHPICLKLGRQQLQAHQCSAKIGNRRTFIAAAQRESPYRRSSFAVSLKLSDIGRSDGLWLRFGL